MTKKDKPTMFYLRIRKTEKEYLVSVCDEELLGETVCEGEMELYVNERFFSGDLVPLEKCLEEIVKATSANMIGQKIVRAAIEYRLVSEHAVKWIHCPKNGNVGHVLLLR